MHFNNTKPQTDCSLGPFLNILIMSSRSKIWLGILTFLPFVLFFVYIILFFTVFLGTITELEQSHHEGFPSEIIKTLLVVFLPILIAIIISLIIMIYYIVHANNNPNNDSGKKIMWTLILILIANIGSIVYYFVEILPDKNLPEKAKHDH